MATVSKNSLVQLETTIDGYVAKAPQLPANIREILVKIAPYLTILSVVLSLPAILALIGLGGLATMLSPLGGMSSMAAVPTMWVGIIMLIPVVILEAMAIPGLFSRSASAWKYLFWAQLISIVSSLLQFNLVSAILGALIGFYFLFQIRSYYK